MKKITKLTALALALALMLGMTAMAGTPSELLVYDDFSDASDLSWDTFGATRTAYANLFCSGSFTFSPVEGATKYYSGTGHADLVNVNGKVVIRDNKFIAKNTDANAFAAAYTLPAGQEWTYEKYGDGSYALVSLVNWTPIAVNTTNSFYGHQGFAGVIFDTVSQDGTTVTKNIGRATMAQDVVKVGDGTTSESKIYFGTGGQSDFKAQRTGDTEVGRKTLITHVVRPFCETLYNAANGEQVLTVPTDESFDLYRYHNREMIFTKVAQGGRFDFRPGADSALDYIKEIKGFWFRSPGFIKSEWHDVMIYKASLDRADFLMETTNISNVAPDGAAEIIFNQPISTSSQHYAQVGSAVDLLPLITVTTGEGDDMVTLTYGEDYTIEVSERIVGTAVKGVMAIKPINDWAFDTTYTVTQPAAVAATRIGMLDENRVPVTFTTEKAPTFTMDLKAYAGLSATGTELSAVSTGTTYFAISAAYSEGKVIANGTLRLEVKDAEGNLVKYVTAKKALGTGTASFGVALRTEEGQKVYASIDGGVIGAASIE